MKKLSVLTLMLSFLLVFTTQAQTWGNDYAAAVAKAKKEDKTLLVNFTGSDWCGWCIRLKKEVFSQEEFQEYAEENLILVELDFPKYKKLPESEAAQNQQLAKKHGIRGFPTILLLDPTEKVLLRTGYKAGGAQNYVDHLDKKIKS